ncbi:MAG: endolytic transglycosylase MltG [Oscillospiraceae bacterium]|nr:endolytic transglycosylase MltG [Oscillospiraceae bacterium]
MENKNNNPPKTPPKIQLDSDLSSGAFFVTDSDTIQLDALKPPPRTDSANSANGNTQRINSIKSEKATHSVNATNSANPGGATQTKPKPKNPNNKSEPGLKKIEELRKKQAYKRKMRRRKEHIRTFSHIFGSLILVVFIVTAAALLSQFIVRAFLDFTGISNENEFSVFVEIPPDSTADEIAEILSSEDVRIISMPGLFSFYARVTKKDEDFLNGLFRLNSTMSYSQIISTLKTNPSSNETVTVKIIEGMTAREIADLLEENEVCRAEDFLNFYKEKMNVYEFEKRVIENPLKFNQMEGYLFPDTHEFFVVGGLKENPDFDTTKHAERAALTIYSHMNSQLPPITYKKIGEMGLNLDQFMTIASMVQREAADIEDMRMVAAVFLNRIRNADTFPRMESDVTEKYANENILPFRNEGNAILIDSMIEAYNSYISLGLPPGPVCNPGMNAITAVLDAPELTKYRTLYYFCSEIETGKMYFAETLAQHHQNEIAAGLRNSNGELIYR